MLQRIVLRKTIKNIVKNAGGYLISGDNTGFGLATGAGPLAYFHVVDGTDNPTKDSYQIIEESNSLADIQSILPTTPESDYDPKNP